MQTTIPEAVGQDKDGFLSLQARPLIAAAVNAIKELASKLTDLATTVANLAQSFTTKELVATSIAADTDTFGQLCVSDVCITRDPIISMVAAASAARRLLLINQRSPVWA